MQLSGFTFLSLDYQCNNSKIIEAIYRLRYQVYVNEWGFESAEDHPSGLEKDCYDRHSRYFYARHGSENNIIGTARIILPSNRPLPIQEHFDVDDYFTNTCDRRIGEISRLAISKDFRRRAIDRVIFNKDNAGIDGFVHNQETLSNIVTERRKCEHDLIRGIYLLIYRDSIKLGLTHWCAVMAKGLYVVLGRWGIRFEKIGHEKNYHGLRAPYMISIKSLEESLKKKNPELLELAKQKDPGA